MDLYIYEGPVSSFGILISEKWYGATRAISEKKARSNLAYQYKKKHNYTADAKIELTGKIVKMSEGEI